MRDSEWRVFGARRPAAEIENSPAGPVAIPRNSFVLVKVSPYGQRTALFGKTRFGKSNTIKIIADTILRSDVPPGQIVSSIHTASGRGRPVRH
jgi:hypothetical protein